jgi:hypothetical protein
MGAEEGVTGGVTVGVVELGEEDTAVDDVTDPADGVVATVDGCGVVGISAMVAVAASSVTTVSACICSVMVLVPLSLYICATRGDHFMG